MINGVPTHEELQTTGIGWLNLAWSNIIDCLIDVERHSEYLNDLEVAEDDERTRKHLARIVKGQRFKINNAISLLQQAVEILLKSRVAETSPFLLIVGDAHSWPKPNQKGHVEFSDFRTLDAVNLCKAANVFGQRVLPPGFIKFFDNLRKSRNKIVHLSVDSVSVQAASEVMLSVLTAHGYIFDGQPWQQFRRNAILTQDRQITEDAEEEYLYLADTAEDQFLIEMECALSNVSPEDAKRFFGFHPERDRLYCHNCWNRTTKYYDREHLFAQRQDDGSILCVACLLTYVDEETYERFNHIV